jgi:outer membrane receptor for ferrienterochelin and colicins
MKKYLIINLIFLSLIINAQEQLKGLVLEFSSTKEMPLPGANVYWLNSSVGTITQEDGTFSLPYKFSYNKLVISYVGFKTDTITVKENKFIRYVLQASDELDAVVLK